MEEYSDYSAESASWSGSQSMSSQPEPESGSASASPRQKSTGLMSESSPMSGYQQMPGLRQRRDLFDALIALGAGVGLPAALRRITEVARDVTGAWYAVFAATAASRGSVPSVLRAGASDEPPSWLADVLADPETMLGVGSLIRLDDLRSHPRRTELPVDLPGGIGMLGTPILSEGELYGGMLLFGSPGTPFTAEHEDALITISAAAGVVISTAALRADAERRQRWLDASADIVRHLLSTESSHQVMDVVAHRAYEVADADAAAIMAPAGVSDQLMVRSVVGASAEAMLERADAAAGGHVAEVLSTGVPRLLDGSAGGASDWDGPCMLVPFSAENRPLGVLVVARTAGRPAFGDADLGMASMFAGHAALAVELAAAHRDRDWLHVLEDRDRVAHDLHDIVIQQLFVTGLQLQSVAQSVADPIVGRRITSAVDELDRTVTEIRRSIFSLRSPLTGRDGLRARLLAQCSSMAESWSGEPQVLLDGPLDMVVSDALGEQLSAALAIGLDNAMRHAQASEIAVSVSTDGTSVLLEVIDNGIGVGANVHYRGGLAESAGRAEQLGGWMRMSSASSGGAKYSWEVPLVAADDR